MKRIDLISIAIVGFIFLAVSGCSPAPSETAIQTAIAQTQAPTSRDLTTPTAESSPPTPKPRVSCPDEEVISYLDELDLLLEEFDDTVEIAGSTARMSLSPVIQDMQSQKREARRLDRPECANYLQDLVVVAMETQIDAFISFLSQDSDSVVSRKMTASEEVRSAVDAEIAAFRSDPMAAYEASELTAESLVESAEQAEPFALPSGWIDIDFPDSDALTLSIPEDWTQDTFGDEDQFLVLKSNDETLTVMMDVFGQKSYTELDTDGARLFSLQTALETEDWDFYSEHSAEIGLYALNRGYVVEFARRYSQSSDIEEGVWAVIVTPDEHEVFAMAYTERDDFAQIDMLTLQQIYGSIRTTE